MRTSAVFNAPRVEGCGEELKECITTGWRNLEDGEGCDLAEVRSTMDTLLGAVGLVERSYDESIS